MKKDPSEKFCYSQNLCRNGCYDWAGLFFFSFHSFFLLLLTCELVLLGVGPSPSGEIWPPYPSLVNNYDSWRKESLVWLKRGVFDFGRFDVQYRDSHYFQDDLQLPFYLNFKVPFVPLKSLHFQGGSKYMLRDLCPYKMFDQSTQKFIEIIPDPPNL